LITLPSYLINCSFLAKKVTDAKYRKACQRYHSYKNSTKIELEVLKNASKRDILSPPITPLSITKNMHSISILNYKSYIYCIKI
jgi:hypothetical protein